MIAMLLLAANALAGSYTVVYSHAWPMKATSPPTGWPSDVKLGVGVMLGRCLGTSCPYNGTETRVAAKKWDGTNEIAWTYTEDGIAKPYASCTAYVEDGYNVYYLDFAADPAHWPASWPTELRCKGNDATNSLLVRVTNITTNTNYAGPSSLLPGATLNFTTGWTMTFTYAGASRRTVNLPAGTYLDQTVYCKKSNGTTWTGVTALVDEKGTTDSIQLSVNNDAIEHTGSCTISKNGVATSFPVTVDRP